MRAYMCDECGRAEAAEKRTVKVAASMFSFGSSDDEAVRELPPETWFALALAHELDGTVRSNDKIAILCSTECLLRWAHRLIVPPRVML